MVGQRNARAGMRNALVCLWGECMPRISRRSLIEAALISASPIGSFNAYPKKPDDDLARLVAEHRRFDEEILAAHEHADELRFSERRAGRGRSDAVEAAYAQAEALHARQGRIANAIINSPSASFVGVAHKLMLWRREAAVRFSDDFFDSHETFTFSAYDDVLRLTGLQSSALACDPATRRRMSRYWL